MSGVSVDNSPAPSDADVYMRLAVEGGNNFMKRLQALADAKAAHDESLAELNLGKAATAALADAQAKLAAAQADRESAAAALTAAQKQAAAAVAKANADAADAVAKATASADALIAEAKQIHGDAQSTKAAADAALAAAQSERAQLRTAQEAAERMAEAGEATRLIHQGGLDRMKAFYQAELGAAAPAATAAMRAS